MSDHILFPTQDFELPNLKKSGFRKQSPKSTDYNCIAWAVHDTKTWWWPGSDDAYWPEGVSVTVTLPAFVAAFQTRRFSPSSTSAVDLIPGIEKVAIYVNDSGVPRHAARQLASGKWTSKLGVHEDIKHSLAALEGPSYGSVRQILERRLTGLSKWLHMLNANIASMLRFSL